MPAKFWEGMVAIMVPGLIAAGMLLAEHQNRKPRRFDHDVARYERNLKRRLKA